MVCLNTPKLNLISYFDISMYVREINTDKGNDRRRERERERNCKNEPATQRPSNQKDFQYSCIGHTVFTNKLIDSVMNDFPPIFFAKDKHEFRTHGACVQHIFGQNSKNLIGKFLSMERSKMHSRISYSNGWYVMPSITNTVNAKDDCCVRANALRVVALFQMYFYMCVKIHRK